VELRSAGSYTAKSGEYGMRASAIEFRLRMAINAAIIILGFWAPWIEPLGLRRTTVLEWLALELSRAGIVRFTVAVPLLIVVSALIAGVGAALRVWGAACLGTGTVNSLDMRAGAVVADGPFRYVRNPLYLGLWFMVVAMAFIMPVTGAVFTLVLITVFLLRLILAEETFLSARLGEPFRLYLRSVPRLIPHLRANLPRASSRPQWMRAVLAELTPIGVFIAMAFLSWSYDARLIGRAILISFGASLVARALMPQAKPEASALD
jgi:protein-S-isoprenylcysteine O-methyltransferase Ste14